MNALSLYVTTCRMIFQADIEDSAGSWSDITRLLLYLRQALTCCVCGKLLTVPMSSTVSSCQHHVCKACVGGKMRLKPSCSWCKDHSKFIENTQLRILLQCYKRLCDFANSSDIPNKWGHLNVTPAAGVSLASASSNSVVSGPTNFLELIEEGCSLGDKFSFSEPPPLRGYNRVTVSSAAASSSSSAGNSSTALSSSIATSNHVASSAVKADRAVVVRSNVLSNGDSNSSSDISSSLSSIVVNGNSGLPRKSSSSTDNSQLLFKAMPMAPNVLNSNITRLPHVMETQAVATATSNFASSSSLSNGSNAASSVAGQLIGGITTTQMTPKVKPKRRGCRCGLATPNPGKLTCCGQRCPCYVDGKGCFECKCRGCRNPHKANTSPGCNVQPATKQPPVVTTNSISLPSKPIAAQHSTTSASANAATTMLSTHSSTATLLSPNLLLSTSVSPTLNLGSSLLTATASPNLMSRGCHANATINFISSSSSSPTAALCVVGGGGPGVGNDSLTLPFPKLEDVEEPEEGEVSTATIGIGTDDTMGMDQDSDSSSQELTDNSAGHSMLAPMVVGIHG